MLSSSANGPLDAAQLEQIALARQRSSKLKTAASLATFNVWTFGICAGLSAVAAVLDWTGLVFAAVLALFAWNEARGRDQLRRFEARGPGVLARNQLGLLACLVAYFVWGLYSTLTGPDPYLAMLAENPDLDAVIGGAAGSADAFRSIGEWARTVSVAIYVCLIAGVVLFQGGMAWYYHSRREQLDAYLKETPPWVVELLKQAG